MMSKTLSVYALIFSLFAAQILAKYCDSQSKCTLAFNLGRFVFFGEKTKARNIWQFDAKNYKIYAQKLDLSDIFYDNALTSVYTSVGFNFINCKTRNTNSDFCRMIQKARNIVLTTGQKLLPKANANKVINAYVAYRMDSDQTPELSQIFDNDMVWELKSQGVMTEKFWKISKNDSDSKPIMNYQSMVFVPQKNELFACIHSGTKNSLYVKKLNDKTGEWSEWKYVNDIGFIGMFCVRNRVFGMDSDNMIYEFIWTASKVEFLKKSNSKEFFDCYRNSTLILPYKPQIFTTTENGENSTRSLQQNSTNIGNALINNTNPSKSNFKWSPMIIIIIVSVVILIAIIVIVLAFVAFILLRKRKSSIPSKKDSNLNANRVGSNTSIKTIRSQID